MNQMFNPLDPMNSSTYLESAIPSSIDEAIAQAPQYTPSPNGPKLKPQPTKDSWYYSKDGADDGRISGFEKFKAFIKGGTYNLVKGLFCDENGFSLGRTAASAAGVAAVALSGPIGVAVAGGIGLFAGLKNFLDSSKLAANATTDAQARKAFEGYGESTSTIGLSLFGGFKSLKAIKNNFLFASKHPELEILKKSKLLNWDISKLFHNKKPVTPSPAEQIKSKQPVTAAAAQTTAAETAASPIGSAKSSETSNIAGAQNQTKYYGDTARTYSEDIQTPQINADGYTSGWETTEQWAGQKVPENIEYFSNSTPTGEISKPQSPKYYSPYAPVDNALLKPAAKAPAKAEQTAEFIPDSAPVDSAIIKPDKPQPDFTYGADNNHFFG